MAEAETSPTAISWPPLGLPIDAACKAIMPQLWAAYVKARDAARGVDDLLSRFRPLSLGANRERLLAEREKARRELETERDRHLEEGEFELWGRPENPWAAPQCIPASALRSSRLDYERQTASGEGWQLHDLRLRRTDKPNNTADRVYTAAQRLKAAGKIPANIRPTHLARLLASEDAKSGNSAKPVGEGHIKNHLEEWGLWPVSRIE